MGKHLITVEVDTDRTKYDTPWAADYNSAQMPDGDVADYAKTFGAEPGAQWDEPPLTRVVSVRKAVEGPIKTKGNTVDEMTNERRAEFGRQAIDVGTPDRGLNGADPEGLQTDGVDTIANVLHALAAAEGCDPAAALRSAQGHFDAEMSGRE